MEVVLNTTTNEGQTLFDRMTWFNFENLAYYLMNTDGIRVNSIDQYFQTASFQVSYSYGYSQ